jgi:hypothetical protein
MQVFRRQPATDNAEAKMTIVHKKAKEDNNAKRQKAHPQDFLSVSFLAFYLF